MQYQEHFLESKSLSYFQELEADIFLQDKKNLKYKLGYFLWNTLCLLFRDTRMISCFIRKVS